MKRLFVALGIGTAVLISALAITLSNDHKTMAPAVTQSYVALGDSVAAGVGLGNYVDASACNRTNAAYPVLLARKQSLRLTSFACSGATLGAGILGEQSVNRLAVPSQLTQLESEPRPDLITITIGANDARWTELLAQCYGAMCESASQGLATADSLKLVQQNLHGALTKINNVYQNSPPKVVLTGYYQVFPARQPDRCLDLTGIDAQELVLGRELQAGISQVIKRTAEQFSFATYVPIDFSGHEMCSENPWVQGLSDKQPYHPTADGQAAIAKQIEAAL